MLIRLVVNAVLRIVKHLVAAAAFGVAGALAVLPQRDWSRREVFAAFPARRTHSRESSKNRGKKW